MMILFILRIKSHGTFYADNSSDCFPCLTASCGLLAAFWALVLAISMVNAREIFIQTGLFFLICLIQTIVLLMSSCWKQIEAGFFSKILQLLCIFSMIIWLEK